MCLDSFCQVKRGLLVDDPSGYNEAFTTVLAFIFLHQKREFT
jgi:hypothetical protein